MNIRKSLLSAFLASLCVLSSCAQSKEGTESAQNNPAAQNAPAVQSPSGAQNTPKLTLSATRIPDKGFVGVKGTGFTAYANVSSHLRRPDQTEFPVLPILTDKKGEFTHEIDTLLFLPGTYELWVVDDTTGKASEIVKFVVTREVF